MAAFSRLAPMVPPMVVPRVVPWVLAPCVRPSYPALLAELASVLAALFAASLVVAPRCTTAQTVTAKVPPQQIAVQGMLLHTDRQNWSSGVYLRSSTDCVRRLHWILTNI